MRNLMIAFVVLCLSATPALARHKKHHRHSARHAKVHKKSGRHASADRHRSPEL